VPGRGADVRRFSLRRANGRFKLLKDFAKPLSCGLVRKSELSGNAFGGRTNKALAIRFRLEEAAKVTTTVRRNGKVVKRFKKMTYQPNRNVTLELAPKGLKKGTYSVEIAADRGQSRATTTLSARKV